MAPQLRPRHRHVMVPVLPLPFDSMCQVQPTVPLFPTGWVEPPNDTGVLRIEYSALAVQTAPDELQAYTIGGFRPIASDLQTVSSPTQHPSCVTVLQERQHRTSCTPVVIVLASVRTGDDLLDSSEFV